jgi:hypothetical protein
MLRHLLVHLQSSRASQQESQARLVQEVRGLEGAEVVQQVAAVVHEHSAGLVVLGSCSSSNGSSSSGRVAAAASASGWHCKQEWVETNKSRTNADMRAVTRLVILAQSKEVGRWRLH